MAAVIQACGGDGEVLFPDLEAPDASFDSSVDAPSEASEDGSFEDAASDALEDARPDAEPVSCDTSADCPLPAHPCLLPLCVGGLCTTTAAPSGTHIPGSAQTPGDCKRLECGEGGELVAKADPADIPLDDNECTEKSCDGPNPITKPVAMGTSCGNDGVCNGSGVCGVCAPNEQSCEGNVPITCGASGAWAKGEACPFVCSGKGNCTGECVPAEVSCSGKQPRVCDSSGQWQKNGNACPNICSSGECAGACSPGTWQCSDKVPQSCDSNGQWKDSPACQYVCSLGACTGVCTPNSTRCSGIGVETCSQLGQWQVTTSCPFTCNSGSCVGVCAPGTLQCSGNVPQECDSNGQWLNRTPCPNACVGGACTNACTPGSKQCNGLVPQTCSASGEWQSGSTCPYVCVSGGCGGVCVPGARRCNGQSPQLCDGNGQWANTGNACTNACVQGVCLDYPLSCNAGPGDGLSNCGANGNESCCKSESIPGGTFYRGYDGVFSSDTSYPATVSGFGLEKYEVTVGRFRKFVAALAEGYKPPAGSGKHAHLNGGGGLNTGAESGWQTAWNTYLPAEKTTWDSATVLACGANATWTPSAGPNERRPINCVSWHQAYAYCIWDGGFLPSEAEWHYVASGGSSQRVFPWSVPSTSTMIDYTYASYACMGDGSAACSITDLVFGGTKPKGLGAFGHADLGGNAFEWVLDMFSASYATSTCGDCANLSTDTATPRVIRGGSWKETDTCSLRAAERRSWGVLSRSDTIGFRCARTP